MRMEEWPGPAGGGARGADWPAALSRRDAGVFARAARHQAREAHLEAIAQEVGWSEAAAPPLAALRALWHGLLAACEDAVRQAGGHDMGQQAKHGHHHEGSARVDFFGHAVHAAELLGAVRQMDILEGKLAGMKVSGGWGAAAGGSYH